MGKVNLCIQTTKGILSLPFKKWKNLDLFTVNYQDMEDLVNGINTILKLSISSSDVLRIYVSYKKQETINSKRGAIIYGTNLTNDDIKYIDDNYDEVDLMFQYAKYLRDDIDRVKTSPIIFVNTDAINKFLYDNGSLTDDDINNAVRIWFENKKTGYRAKRKLYYIIKRNGYQVKIKPIKKSNSASVDRSLTSFETNDEYLDYLIQVLSREDIDYDQIMDEIASYDIKCLNGFKMIDGQNEGLKNDDDGIYELAQLSGLSIYELQEISADFSKIYGRSRR